MTAVADAMVMGPASRRPSENPFISISDAARLAIILYFVIWRIIPTVAVLAADSTLAAGYAVGIALARFGTELLLLLPFLVHRFGGTPIGWLHPLVLPTLISVSFGIIRDPSSLLLPLSVWGQAQQGPTHELLIGWPAWRILEAQLLMNGAALVAIACTYIGFVFFRQQRRPVLRTVRLNRTRVALIFALFLAIVLLFLQMQGGILNHMASFAAGRFGMRETSGQFLVLNAFLPYILILWYLHRPSALRSPVFLGAFAVAAMMQFVVTGSRSGLIIPFAALLIGWMYVNKKVLVARAVLLGLVAFLLIGALGEIRQSGRDGEVDFAALTEFNIAQAWQSSQDELERRSKNASLAIFALVPQDVGHIHGVTYLAAVGFMVPRALWSSKPRGGGAYAAALLYMGLPTVDGYRGASYPISGYAEAYWSFHIPGVIVIFLLYGAAIRLVLDWVQRDGKNPFAILTFILFVLWLDQPNTDSLVRFLQHITLLYFMFLFVSRRIA